MRDRWEQTTEDLYSYDKLARMADGRILLFHLPIGATYHLPIGATYEPFLSEFVGRADTNMVLYNQLPAGHEFIIQALDVRFYPDQNAVRLTKRVYSFYSQALLTLMIGSKQYLQVPVSSCISSDYLKAMRLLKPLEKMKEPKYSRGYDLGEKPLQVGQDTFLSVELMGIPSIGPGRVGVHLRGISNRRVM